MQTVSIFSRFDGCSISKVMMFMSCIAGVFVFVLGGWITCVLLPVAGLVLFLRNRIPTTKSQQSMIMVTQKDDTENPRNIAKSTAPSQSKQDIIEHILAVVDSKQPETVEQLLRLVSQEYSLDKKEVMDCILLLQKQGKLKFVASSAPHLSSKQWFFSTGTVWFWIITIFAIVTTAVLLDVTAHSSAIYSVRPLFASVFIFCVPGYSLTKALFVNRELDSIEKIALSIVMSVSLVLAIAFIFNYTPWGIRLVPVTLGILAVTLISSIVALVRGYRSQFWGKKPKLVT